MEQRAQRDPNIAGRLNLYGVQVAFANGLNVAQAGKPDASGNRGAPKYSASFLFDKNNAAMLTEIQGLMWAVCKAKWNDKAEVMWKSLWAGGKVCLRDGDSRTDEGFAGQMFVAGGARQEQPPILYDEYVDANGRLVELPRPQGVITSGCYANVQCDIWAQDNDWGRRINCDIKLVQFAGKGQNWGGGGPAADASAFMANAKPQPNGGFGAPMPQGGGAPMQMPAPQGGFNPAAAQQFAPQQAAPQQFAPQQAAPQGAPQMPAGFPAQQAAPAPWAPQM